MSTCDALSAPVAALVQVCDIDPDDDAAHSLLLWYNDRPHDSVCFWPKLRFDDGLLSPVSLLGPHIGAGGTAGGGACNQETGVLEALDARPRTPDSVMQYASRRLRLAASRAAADVAELARWRSDRMREGATLPSLPPRVDAALDLLMARLNCTDGGNGGDQEGFCCAHLSATQLLLAELEVTLEGIFFSTAGKDESGASGIKSASGHPKLKDVLRVEAVRSALGLPLTLVLHVLLGPLNGVCLRNLVWHGYLGPREVERSQWAPLLCLITAFALPSACSKLASTPTVVSSKAADQPLLGSGVTCSPRDCVPSESVIDLLLDASPTFIPEHMRPAFIRSMNLCRKGKGEFEVEAQVGHWTALALLYSILERGLRALFARENPQLDPSPELARVDVLHLTMAAMLRLTVTDNSDSSEESTLGGDLEKEEEGGSITANGLLLALGDGPVAALYDEFVWMGLPDASGTADEQDEEPPPCRNELVHGTIPLGAVPPGVLLRLVRLTVGLTVLSLEMNGERGKSKVLSDPCIQSCFNWILHYQPKRHPVCQLWRLFRVVCRSHHYRQCSMVDALLPWTCEEETRIKPLSECTFTGSTNPTGSVQVEYCPVCSLPLEYCVYSPDPVQCLEHRFGQASSDSLPGVVKIAKLLVDRLIHKFSSDAISHRDVSLAMKAEATRQKLASAVGLGNVSAENIWEKLDAVPARRSAAEAELGKLWALREAVINCGEISQSARRRLIGFAACAARGESRIRVGSKKQPLAAIVHRLMVTLQGVELVLVILMQQYFAANVTSLVLPTFLSLLSNTVLNHIENGRFKLCVGIIAGLLGGGCGICQTCDEIVREELPRADRQKFSFQLERYIQYAVHGQPFDEEIVKNRFVLGNSIRQQRFSEDTDEHTEQEKGEKGLALPPSSGVAWESLRRWQQMSTLPGQEQPKMVGD